MNLQTKIPLKKQEYNLIDYNSKVFLLGSCFAENIGEKFDYFKFQQYVNPFGILFHPIAIHNLVSNALQGKKYTEDDVFINNEQFHSFDAHSKLSQHTKSLLLHQLNAASQKTSHYLKQSTHVVITLGTAWVYRYIMTNKIVANCHKIPQQQFQKQILSVDVIVAALQSIIEQVKKVNPKVNFIFTVSPVRHIKDGFVENTQSKSHLIAALHKVLGDQSYYFPSYEIMMDELRDYRFYNQDLLHPSPLAVDYIWDRFKTVWMADSANTIMTEVDTIQKGLQHKPFNPNSTAHLKFVQQLVERQITLTHQYPNIKF
ncbi:GSCFA domain-containing protein [Olleya marilimosa]|uniref:GSCFA domain-containing protein n=1 Tax=Olleya marilimosa TaxID=272164 RepID=A0ABR8LXK7_9FLAO|nr:GSCFA domain-containing protein [Olleya marilimosa]MBD3864376.1 GSCFA domain-containing protein [Olleya marilimosa]MBD3891721.1 GSCFA domain-containing protein [Olleya marilimosa]